MNKYLCTNPCCKYSEEFYYTDKDKRTCVFCKSKLEKIKTSPNINYANKK